MELTRNFKQISKSDVSIAGGKGASLGEMTQANIPVPEGFVVLSNSFENFIEETGLNIEIDASLDKVNTEDVSSVEEASEVIQSLILSREMPEEIKKEIKEKFDKLNCQFVAVRSSATSEDSASAAWAGQLDTFLNTTKENLLENVKKCWASLFTPRAIFYRFEQGLDQTKISVAVVIQKMVNSEESGIAFSVHPVTQDENQLIIEAGFGLGESIVSGQITPDSYVVDKQDWNIIDVNVNEQKKGLFRKNNGGNEWKELGEKGKEQVLIKEEIIELSKLIVNIENHYGFPCDIEWAKEKGKFYIVQSRPITTLTKKQSKKNLFGIEFKRETSIGNYYIWLEGYLEACKILDMNLELPKKTFGIYEDGIVKGYTQKDNIRKMEISINKLNKNKLKVLIDEYVKEYDLLNKNNNLNNEEFMRGLIGGFVIVFVLGDMINHPLQKKALEARIKTEKLFYSLSKSNLYKKKIVDDKILLTRDNILPIKDNEVDRYLDENNISIEENTNKREYSELVHLDLPLSLVELHYEQESTEDVVWSEEKFSIKPYIFYERRNGLVYLFYDSKGIEWQIEQAGRYKDEEYAINTIKSKFDKIKKTLEDENPLDKKEFIEFIKNIRDLWPWMNYLWWAIEYKEKNKKPIENLIKVRKYTEHFTPGLIAVLKKSTKKMFPEKRKYANVLLLSEIEKESFPSDMILEKRIKSYAYTNNKFYDSVKQIKKEFDIKIKEEDVKEKKELHGQVAYPGRVKGIVKMVETREDVKNFKKGEIIVSSTTTPDFFPAMKKSLAILSEHGGAICHASITSRELKIPCVVGIKGITRALKTGDEIEVDAGKGIIKIIKKFD